MMDDPRFDYDAHPEGIMRPEYQRIEKLSGEELAAVRRDARKVADAMRRWLADLEHEGGADGT